jgi:hypothetical protein
VKTQFAKEDRVLAYEICHMVDGRLLSYLVKMGKTDGVLLLQTLHTVVTRVSTERTAAPMRGLRRRRHARQKRI